MNPPEDGEQQTRKRDFSFSDNNRNMASSQNSGNASYQNDTFGQKSKSEFNKAGDDKRAAPSSTNDQQPSGSMKSANKKPMNELTVGDAHKPELDSYRSPSNEFVELHKHEDDRFKRSFPNSPAYSSLSNDPRVFRSDKEPHLYKISENAEIQQDQ